MMKINSVAELKAEQNKLRSKKVFLETEITTNLDKVKAELEPLRLLTKGARDFLVNKNNGILSNSLGSVANFLTKNVFLKNSGFITRMIIPYLVKNSTSNLVEKNRSEIVGWLGDLVSKFVNKKTA